MKSFFIMAIVLQFHHLLNDGKSAFLDRPAGSYQTIIEWKDKGYHCLVYKTPLLTKKKEALGELFFLRSEKKGCPLASGKREYLKNGIKALKLRNIVYDKGLTFEVSLQSGDLYKFEFPFPDRAHSRWHSLYPFVEKEKPLNISFKKGDLCMRRGSNCELLGDNHCGHCLSWTPFIDLNCSQKVSGVCGQGECGARGQKACLRMVSLKKIENCSELKPFVFCQFGLEVECQSNGEVTCR